MTTRTVSSGRTGSSGAGDRNAELTLLRAFAHASILHMAREAGIDSASRKGTSLIPRLAEQLFDPTAITTRLAGLEPNERAVLDLVLLMGGEALVSVLRRRLEDEGTIDPQQKQAFWDPYRIIRGDSAKRGSRVLEDILARLGVTGLAFAREPARTTEKLDLAIPGRYVVIPEPIRLHLPAVSYPLEFADPPLVTLPADPEAFIRDLYVLAGFATDTPIPLGASGLIPKRMLLRIHEMLLVADNVKEVRSEAELGRFTLLRAVAEQLGLLRRTAEGLRLTDSAPAIFQGSRGERYRRSFDAYRQNTQWSELSRIHDLAIYPKNNLVGPGVAKARQRVLAELAELPAGEWFPIDYFIERMRLRRYEFLFSRSSEVQRPNYYHRMYAHPDLDPYDGQNDLDVRFVAARPDDPVRVQSVTWDDVEGVFIRTVLTEALAWLGLVDLGLPSEDANRMIRHSPTAFRLTPEAGTLLHGHTPDAPPDQANVVIQPNFQILSFEPTGPDVLLKLDRIAERVRLDLVVEHHLTRDSVYAAQRGGLSIAEIITFLEEVANSSLPQNVRRSLEEWGAQLDRVVVRRNGALLQTASEATLDALYADAGMALMLGRRLGPRAALVKWRQLAAVRAALVEGKTAVGPLLPALSEGNDAYDSPEIEVSRTDGLIKFRRRVPSMYARQALRTFSEEQPDGTLQLTPASLRRAARAKISPDDMIATLGTLHAGPLSPDTASLVKRWAKDWGSGTLTQTYLLHVESDSIMHDLLADPQIKSLLHPLPGASQYATVSTGAEARIRELLAERGMDLDAATEPPNL